jgi:glycosyltransferase involved in cell wall biosynthesis
MRILIITQIYLPEMGALSNRLYPIISKLVEAGHDVSVATGMPNYPAGKVFPEYRGKLSVDEVKDGCRILRTNYYTTPRNKSKLRQLLSYISFMPAVLLSGIRAGKTDVVIITSPPIFPVVPAMILAKLRGAKLVFDIRDIWSDELMSFGGMSENSIPVRVARTLENWGYRTADLVTATTEALAQTVKNRGAGKEKTSYLPNGADLELFKPVPVSRELVAKYELDDRFVVMYSGLFGIKHGLETLLDAAAILREHKNIVFLLLGNGARREKLIQYVEENSLENVEILDEINVREVPKFIAAADVCYAAFMPGQYTKKIISVKLFEYLACEKPVVGGFEGESARIIQESNGGIAVTPGDPEAIASAILKLYDDPEQRRQSGKSGRKYVEENHSRMKWAANFEQKLAGLIEQPIDLPPQKKTGASKLKHESILSK